MPKRHNDHLTNPVAARPQGREPLEWLLLTNSPAVNAEELRTVADDDACRMQIEEFHKAQKTGCRIESCELQSGKKVKAWIAMVSVVAVRMMNLRLAARVPQLGDKPVSEVVPALWVEVLKRAAVRARPLETVRDFLWHLAWLGGYMRDRPDRDRPGWITLWRGWCKLHILLRYEMSR